MKITQRPSSLILLGALITGPCAEARLYLARDDLGQQRGVFQDPANNFDYAVHGEQSTLFLHQQPLTTGSPFKAGSFTKTRQSDTTCASYGEQLWAGTVDVSDDHQLFYWFAESRNDPANDPVILWINGGPGASSMMGLFTEIGPCILEPGHNVTTPNPWAWNNNASVVFLDQPAGVGFSLRRPDGEAIASKDEDGASDFQTFLNIFFQNVFPEKAHLPLTLTGESYGGHYIPTYVNHILESRSLDSAAAFRGNITSIILVNALLDFTATAIGSYELLCTSFRGQLLPAEDCETLRRELPQVTKLGQICDVSNDPHSCWAVMQFNLDRIMSLYGKRIARGEGNNYNSKLHNPIQNSPA